MLRYLPVLAWLILFSSCTTTRYFIVRHAEKQDANANMSTDVPLSEEGKQRAQSLKEQMAYQKVRAIYSTNYIRTKSTAQPTSDLTGVPIEIYEPFNEAFIEKLKEFEKGDVLVVGHSNTVDDLVNKLMGEKIIESDLPDTEYGSLFVVIKKGKKYSFEKRHFGKLDGE